MRLPGKSEIFGLKHNEKEAFDEIALSMFRFQAENNSVYKDFISYLGKDVSTVRGLNDIPFLPIRFFKEKEVRSVDSPVSRIFTSSSTGGLTSQHQISDISWYEESFLRGFSGFYGDPGEWVFLCLLPGYREREGSSLVYMCEVLVERSKDENSGFYLYEHNKLKEILEKLRKEKKKTLLIGVTYALLDFTESFPVEFPELIVMETGGMKGKRKELTREELHKKLCTGFGVSEIHSEYGMTELLSQAYSSGEGLFSCPPWMKVSVRDVYDPFRTLEAGQGGGINIIDLANYESCSFLATDDLGKIHGDGRFEITGRLDNSDIRGCNLMI